MAYWRQRRFRAMLHYKLVVVCKVRICDSCSRSSLPNILRSIHLLVWLHVLGLRCKNITIIKAFHLDNAIWLFSQELLLPLHQEHLWWVEVIKTFLIVRFSHQAFLIWNFTANFFFGVQQLFNIHIWILILIRTCILLLAHLWVKLRNLLVAFVILILLKSQIIGNVLHLSMLLGICCRNSIFILLARTSVFLSGFRSWSGSCRNRGHIVLLLVDRRLVSLFHLCILLFHWPWIFYLYFNFILLYNNK